MSYKCAICKQVVPAGQPRLVHLVKRQDGSVSREIAVCRHCHESLTGGATVATLLPSALRLPVVRPVDKSVKQFTKET